MIDFLISSPFPLDSSQGNAVSVLRLEKMLREMGYDARAREGYDGEERARGLIALNAWRNAEAVGRFARVNPGARILIQMTGTDLHGEEITEAGSPTRRALDMADGIAVFHEGSLHSLPEEYHVKTVVTPCSIDPDRLPRETWSLEACQSHGEERQEFRVVMVGNLRPVKGPEVLLDALDCLPESSRVVARFYGECTDSALEARLRTVEQAHSRTRWQGSVSWEQSVGAILKSGALINSSKSEGAANAVCEAMNMGVPVLASDIPGNTGLLGGDYEGLFPSGDSGALSELLQRGEREPAWLEMLSADVQKRALLFTPEREKQGWRKLLLKTES